VAAREDAARGNVCHQVIHLYSDGSHGVRLAIRSGLEAEVEALRGPAPAGQEYLNVIGHAGDELRAFGRAYEGGPARVAEQHRGLREPPAQDDAVLRLERADPRPAVDGPPEAVLKDAHPARVAIGADTRGHASDAFRGRRA